ncbi:MAG TPA: hypothetical protein PLJ00_17030 [Chitinophagales bacterium]|nr:hypothetical protein [Chitinophagales bacterium]HRG87340.1 hypothetical protein [Chitinophagales bacterium]
MKTILFNRKSSVFLLLNLILFSAFTQVIPYKYYDDVFIFSDYSYFTDYDADAYSELLYMHDDYAVIQHKDALGKGTRCIYANGKRAAQGRNAEFANWEKCEDNSCWGDSYFVKDDNIYVICKVALKTGNLFHVFNALGDETDLKLPMAIDTAFDEKIIGKNGTDERSKYYTKYLPLQDSTKGLIYFKPYHSNLSPKTTKLPCFLYDFVTGEVKPINVVSFAGNVSVNRRPDQDYFLFKYYIEQDFYYGYYDYTHNTGGYLTDLDGEDVTGFYFKDGVYYCETEKRLYKIESSKAVRMKDVNVSLYSSDMLVYDMPVVSNFNLDYKWDKSTYGQKNQQYPQLVKNGVVIEELPFLVQGYAKGLNKIVLFADVSQTSYYFLDSVANANGNPSMELIGEYQRAEDLLIKKYNELVELNKKVDESGVAYETCYNKGTENCESLKLGLKFAYENYHAKHEELSAALEKHKEKLDTASYTQMRTEIDNNLAAMQANPLMKYVLGW